MNRNLSRLGINCSAAIAVFIGIALAPAARAQVSVEIRTVALTGDPAPGTGLTFNSFGEPKITHLGQVGFYATLVGANESNDDGIWVETTDGTHRTLALAVRAGDPAPVPGIEGVTFSTIGPFDMNDAQQMTFHGALAGAEIGPSLWVQSGATLSLIARAGVTPPDEAGMLLEGLEFTFLRGRLDAADRVTFFSEILGENPDGTPVNEDNENDGGVWSEKSGANGLTLVLVAREGQPAPNRDGEVICDINETQFGPSSAGKVAFRAFLKQPSCLEKTKILSGIWKWDQGDLGLFLGTGDQATNEQGEPLPGVFFTGFNKLTLNRHGRAAFLGGLFGDVETTNSGGLWAESPQDKLRLVARRGDPAPGTEAGVAFDSFYHILHSGSGDVAFFASVAGDGVASCNNQGIWAGDWYDSSSSHVFRLVARAGDPAPGTGSGVSFDAFDRIALNMGQVAFRGRLRGPDIDPTNKIGLFAEDPFGDLNLIARTGDYVEVRPGDSRTRVRVDAFLHAGTGEYGQNSYLSDLGEVVFRSTFTDGSEGIFVATFVEGASEPPDGGSEPVRGPKGKSKTDCDTGGGGGGKGGGGKGGGGKPPKQ